MSNFKTLRKDIGQWLIDDRESVTLAVRALEAFSMRTTGFILARHSDVRMRALGNLMHRIGEARLEWMKDSRDAEVQETLRVSDQLITILNSRLDTAEADSLLDELHAIAFWLDSELREVGMWSDTWASRLARGES